MYENQTHEVILKRMLNNVSSNMDKREGAIIYDTLSVSAIERAKGYIELDWFYDQMFADTANYENLMRHCKDRGLEPYAATKAILKGEFNMDIAIGSRFSLDVFQYHVTKKIKDGTYELECETAGLEGNRYLGALVPVDYIKGLTRAELTEVLIPGSDKESLSHLLKRYLQNLKTQAFGGNKADYIEKVNAIPGVGAVKVIPVWAGGGTVKIVILDVNYDAPSDALLVLVKNTIDPEPYSGEGYGLAPIGHTVTVIGADIETLSIQIHLTYQDRYDFDTCKQDIENTINNYLKELKETWEDLDNKELVIRISQIESRLLDLDGILDVSDTTINGGSNNYIISPYAIPKVGEIIGT